MRMNTHIFVRLGRCRRTIYLPCHSPQVRTTNKSLASVPFTYRVFELTLEGIENYATIVEHVLLPVFFRLQLIGGAQIFIRCLRHLIAVVDRSHFCLFDTTQRVFGFFFQIHRAAATTILFTRLHIHVANFQFTLVLDAYILFKPLVRIELIIREAVLKLQPKIYDLTVARPGCTSNQQETTRLSRAATQLI